MHQDPLMRPTLPLDSRQDYIAQWTEPANCWDGERLKTIPLATLYHNKILPPTMYYTPDGSKLVVIDPHTITIRTSFAGFISTWIYENDKRAAYRASAISSCGKRLAVYDAQSNTLKIFDLAKRRNTEIPISYTVSECLFTQPVSHSSVVELQQPQTILNFHPTGSTPFSAFPSTFATLNLSVLPNPANPLLYQPMTDTQEDPIPNVYYTNDGLAVIISHKNSTAYTLLSTGEVTLEVEHPVPARVVAITPNGDRLILGSYNGDIWSISRWHSSSFIASEDICWVPVWRGVDGYPVDSIDIAIPSYERATSAGIFTVAVVSGGEVESSAHRRPSRRLLLGVVEYKKRLPLLAKIKPRVEGESHLEIALWSGDESKITFRSLIDL